ncbi:MAG: hypothetical protein ABIM89_08745, partial [Mycobacteriales bacterium]
YRVLSYRSAAVDQVAYTDDAHAGLADLGHLRPGQRVSVVVRMRNAGTATWRNSGERAVTLGTDQPRDRDSAFRDGAWPAPHRAATLTEAEVPPGQIGTFRFHFRAPLRGANATEHFRPVANNTGWFAGSDVSFALRSVPIVGMAATPSGLGYWLVAGDGGVFSFGDAPFYGSAANIALAKPIVGMAATRSGRGYWLVGADGGVFSYGDAQFYGSTAGAQLNAPMVGIAASISGRGYYLVGADGGVFAFPAGDATAAPFHGSMGGQPLNKPVVGMAVHPTGGGYYLVAADGGVFAFPVANSAAAPFFGSAASMQLQKPVVGMAMHPAGTGYWLVGADGGVFTFREAGAPVDFHGSLGGTPPEVPVVGIAASRTGGGYWLVGGAETVTAFGDAGRPAESPLPAPLLPDLQRVVPPTLGPVPMLQRKAVPAAALACAPVGGRRATCVARRFQKIAGRVLLLVGSGSARRTARVKFTAKGVARIRLRTRVSSRLRGQQAALIVIRRGHKRRIVARTHIK